MDMIVNEVELKKSQREKNDIERLKKEGKKGEEITAELKRQTNNKQAKNEDVVVCRTQSDIQKLKIERLMNDPTKEVFIPEPRKEWKPRDPAEFVRHVMGSSAGAGSGEFHVYRGIRRREAKRTEYLNRKARKDNLDDEYHLKIDGNKATADKATEKKRLKRQKKKQKKIMSKKLKLISLDGPNAKSSSFDDDGGKEVEEEEEKHFVIGGR